MYSKALIVALGLVLLCFTTSTSAQRANITCVANRCNWQTATDLRGQATVEIDFADYFYSPACIRISANTTIMFNGSFSTHPLAPGTVTPGYLFTEDNTSFVGNINSGNFASFTTTTDNDLGVYPYVCIAHYYDDMYGAIWVEDDSSEEAWSAICGAPIITVPEAAPVASNDEPITTVPAVQLSSDARVLGFSAGLIVLLALLL